VFRCFIFLSIIVMDVLQLRECQLPILLIGWLNEWMNCDQVIGQIHYLAQRLPLL